MTKIFRTWLLEFVKIAVIVCVLEKAIIVDVEADLGW